MARDRLSDPGMAVANGEWEKVPAGGTSIRAKCTSGVISFDFCGLKFGRGLKHFVVLYIT